MKKQPKKTTYGKCKLCGKKLIYTHFFDRRTVTIDHENDWCKENTALKEFIYGQSEASAK